ncbi:hypothetical protein NST38_30865 [Paenibacillus sp. FSL H8-0104]|uniref:hypothetical protein n=1 Tax=Paenibacillus sp. FSL H8-0104 TaxID=2954509 RepID=UPI0030FD895E
MNKVVISDTDIIVHLVKGDVFKHIVPSIIDKLYITPKVDEELRTHSAIYSQISHLFEVNLFKTKDMWGSIEPAKRIAINEVRKNNRARLDPGELDCLAYAVGLDIDVIISDDKGAKEIINDVTDKKTVVITFWDLLIIGAMKDKFSWETAATYYTQVVDRCDLTLANFKRQNALFEQNTLNHPWVQQYLST